MQKQLQVGRWKGSLALSCGMLKIHIPTVEYLTRSLYEVESKEFVVLQERHRSFSIMVCNSIEYLLQIVCDT